MTSGPIGTSATGTRLEGDLMGQIEVPAEHYWGAQTQRSLIHDSMAHDPRCICARDLRVHLGLHLCVHRRSSWVNVCLQTL
jgi:hypothetical protein